MNDFDTGSFSDVSNTPLGRDVWAYLHTAEALACLETTTYLKHPALEGLQPHLLAKFGEPIRADRIKQMTGKMVRQIMESRGYTLDQTDVRIRVDDLYRTAARYAKRPEGDVQN